MNCKPSRFIEEVDPSFIKVNTRYGSREPKLGNSITTPGVSSNYARNLIANRNNAPKAPPQYHKPASDFTPSDTSNLEAGMKVEHPKFGFGKVHKMETEGSNRKAKVIFENFGEKTLLLSFAKLRIVE